MAQAGTPGAYPGIESYPLEFSGSGGEYFRVWLVNVLLTVVTLGFYTPFARRRTAQYFYAHTLVADSPLEFTAQQRRMVLGFLLLVLLYIGFKTASQTGQDTLATSMLLAVAVLAPYFWASAMRFRLNATRWRGVRLQFTAGWGEVYLASWPLFVAALAWVAAFLLARLLLPDAVQLRPWDVLPVLLACMGPAVIVTILCIIRLEFNYKSLLVLRGRVGAQPGRWKPVFADFVRIWMATLGVLVASVVVILVLVVLAVGGSMALLADIGNPAMLGFLFAIVFALAGLLLLVLASAPARAYREARMFQLVWNNIGVSRVARFRCDLRARRYVALRVKNVLLTLLTLGFYRPFARVSEYRMKTESVTLHVKGGLEQFAGQLAREEQGLGDAIADAAGLDLVG